MLGKVDELAVQDDNVNIPFVTIGETVKVIDGPFNGFQRNCREDQRREA